MVQWAMSQMTTYRWSFEQDMERYAAAGYDAAGVWRQKLSDCGHEQGLTLLADRGLGVSSLSWAGGFTGSEGWTHAESLDDARQALELSAALRSHCLIVHSGARGLHTQNHVRRLLRQAIDFLLPLAESLDVTLALEPMHHAAAARWTFLSDLGEALRMAESYGSAHLKLVLDCYDWGQAAELRHRLPQLVPHLALVQLADSKGRPCCERSRCPLGTGIIPLERLIGELTEAGYRGPYEVELLGEEIEASDYESLLVDSLQTARFWMARVDRAAMARTMGDAG